MTHDTPERVWILNNSVMYSEQGMPGRAPAGGSPEWGTLSPVMFFENTTTGGARVVGAPALWRYRRMEAKRRGDEQ